MKIHDTFHTFLLRLAVTNFLTEQIQSSLFLIVINEKKKYEINDILNSRYHYDKLQYKNRLNRSFFKQNMIFNKKFSKSF
jgi:hypothetical protein